MKQNFKNLLIIKLIFTILHLNLSFQQDWFNIDKAFENNFRKSDLHGWTNSKKIKNLVTKCDSQTIVGGPNKFGKGTKFQKTYENLPNHKDLKISFTLWQIENIITSRMWDEENIQVSIDGKSQKSHYIYEQYKSILENCSGKQRFIRKVNIIMYVKHEKNALQFLIQDSLKENPAYQSWGISNLKIKYQCIDSKIGNLCLERDLLETCDTLLQNLSEKHIYTYSSEFKHNTEQRYLFNIVYQGSYKHNPKCFQQKIHFQGQQLEEGIKPSQFYFNKQTQTLSFSIKHTDIDKFYKCAKIETYYRYSWLCDTSLSFYLGGILQVEYQFQVQIILNRSKLQGYSSNVLKNPVPDDKKCCENSNSVETQLKFCKTFLCTEYYNNFREAKIKQDIYVEHSIISGNIEDNSSLQGVMIKLGPYIPIIKKKNENIPGKVIYHFCSEIPFNNTTLEVISNVQNSHSQRRFLNYEMMTSSKKGKNQLNLVKSEYEMQIIDDTDGEILEIYMEKKDDIQIDMQDENEYQKQSDSINPLQEEQSDSFQQQALIYIVVCLIIVFFVLLISCCVKLSRNKQKDLLYQTERDSYPTKKKRVNTDIHTNIINKMDQSAQSQVSKITGLIQFDDSSIMQGNNQMMDQSYLSRGHNVSGIIQFDQSQSSVLNESVRDISK